MNICIQLLISVVSLCLCVLYSRSAPFPCCPFADFVAALRCNCNFFFVDAFNYLDGWYTVVGGSRCHRRYRRCRRSSSIFALYIPCSTCRTNYCKLIMHESILSAAKVSQSQSHHMALSGKEEVVEWWKEVGSPGNYKIGYK